ncbi:MAG: hypothetical protein F6J93_15950 [Oscillatoria sp. SIO1A7]|nr:hypothetical protein [Oscillatoria sp. SIO1A7]
MDILRKSCLCSNTPIEPFDYTPLVVCQGSFENKTIFSNAQCPMPNAQCPILY